MYSQLKTIGIIIIVGLIGYFFFVFDIPYRDAADSFTTCAGMGNPVMESYPRQCRDKNGTLFVEEILETSSTTSISNTL